MAIRYEKDYLQRLIQNFFLALDRIINARKKKDYERVYSELEITFLSFFEKSITFFEELSPEQIIHFFNDDPYPTEKIEMVALLLFEAGVIASDKDVMKQHLTTVNSLLLYISDTRKSVSLDHLSKQQYIRKVLE